MIGVSKRYQRVSAYCRDVKSATSHVHIRADVIAVWEVPVLRGNGDGSRADPGAWGGGGGAGS